MAKPATAKHSTLKSKKLKSQKFKMSPAVLFVVLFAAVGAALLLHSFAQSGGLPANDNDIVAAYFDEKPTVAQNNNDQVAYLSSGSQYIVLKNGTIICDNGETDGSVLTGQLGPGEVSKIHDEFSGDLAGQPTSIGIAPGSVEAQVNEYQGYMFGNKDGAHGTAIFKGGSKPNKLAKAQARLAKACQTATTKAEHDKTPKVKRPHFVSVSGATAHALVAALFPKAAAQPPANGATNDPTFATNEANGIIWDHVAYTGTPLTRNGCLDGIASSWASQMAQAGTISHNQTLATSVSNCGHWTKIGEIVGVVSSGPNDWQILLNAYMNSPAHKAIIVDPTYNYFGSGTYKTSDGREFHVADFARL